MGVPKFFRYISERYPCLSEVVKEYQIPEFDNLYLDMNGIIHMCSHPNDFDPHFRITDEQIFKDIFHYIEILFRMIQPQRLFFMAVDGVAPRAKMNQQRGRRFRSAKEAEVLETQAKDRGEVLPDLDRFDSNCITPGTEFMTQLQEQLKYFVTYKVSTDKLWQKVKVILSGHQVPGEGEHKIMDYIRYLKSQPGYDNNTRHCLYGLDADLIMLGLCTHEPHFSLLREEVKFGRKNQKRNSTPEETTFYLLHLSLMREYVDLEFQQLKTTLPFPYDLEHIIDDWVLMGFLVGNDFIPNLPELHIANGALPILYSAYIDVLPTLGGYLNEGGTLRLERFQKYLEKLAGFDLDKFKDKFADLKYFESKTGRRPNSKERNPSLKPGEDTVKNKELANLIKETEMLDQGSDDIDCYISRNEDINDDDADMDSDEDSTFFAEFSQHKNDYYINKLEYKKVTPEVLRGQAEGYVRAIQWNLNYYYNGCCSWSWFYPHHYAPYISDIKDFANFKLEFEMGKPFLPFQQLLAVLPAASKKLLPVPFQELMVDDDSPIIEFYPSHFKTDMNGKKQEWEAVVLIPFIHQESLINAMETKMYRLTDEEIKRNTHGPMQVYTYSSEDLGQYVSPSYFPHLLHNHAKVYEMWREELVVDRSKLVKGLCPGVKLDVYFPGFPTLKHIAFTASLITAKVKVFDQPSRGENMILRITPQGNPNIKEVAAQLIGKTIYVNWPHLIEAKVIAVANESMRYVLSQAGNGSDLSTEELTRSSQVQWISSKQGIEERYMTRMGIDIGKTQILVYGCNLEGRKYVFGLAGKITLEKQWCKTPMPYALQTTVRDIAVNDPTFVQYRTLEEVFPVNTTCFLLGPPLYGTMGKVIECGTNGRVSIEANVTTEPDLAYLKQTERETRTHYMPVNAIVQKLGIGANLFLRITGTIYITTADCVDPSFTENLPKVNIGLNLKFNKKNEEVCGYTRRENGYWLYSTRTLDLVKEYINKFPELFEFLGCNYHNNDIFGVKSIFSKNSAERLKELTTWLKEQPAAKAERQTCGAQVLEEDLVKAIENTVDTYSSTMHHTNIITMQVKPHLLYLPKLYLGMLSPDPNAVHRLFDRVINVRDCYTVPLGLKGTIIGIHGSEKEMDIMYDIVFDKQFVGGVVLRCSEHRGYRMTCQSFINLTYGMKHDRTKSQTKPTAVVQPSGPTDSINNVKQFGHNSAFASWRNKPNQSYQPNVKKQEDEASPFLKALEKKMTPPPSSRPKAASNPSSSEFQAMQNELQKSGSSQTQKPPITTPSQEPQVDALKKILKIADDSPSKQKQADGLTTVEVRWQNDAAGNTVESGLSYCVQLINYFQQSGTFGVPYYRYEKKPEGYVATVCIPKGGVYTGSPAPGKEQAAENAAKVAIKHLIGDQNPQPVLQPHTPVFIPNAATASLRPPLLMTPPQQFSHGFNRLLTPRPNVNSWREPGVSPNLLPTPPQQWCQQNIFKPDNMALNWRQGMSSNPLLMKQNPSTPLNPFYLPHHPQMHQTSPNWHTVINNPFIPLQADMKMRQIHGGPQEKLKDNQQIIQAQPDASERQKDAVFPAPNNQSNIDDKPRRPYRKPKKSRIAAKFSLPIEDPTSIK